MKEFVAYVIKALVNRPDAVLISEIHGKHTIIIEVRCDANDMGRVIGRSGKTIGSLRMLVNSIAAKKGCKATLAVVE